MDKKPHVATPFKTEVRGHRDNFCDIVAVDGYPIVSNVGIETARRIVACVNACAHVSTEFLENTPDLATAFMSAENARLMQVNAELIALVKGAYRKQNSEYLTLLSKYTGTRFENDHAIQVLRNWIKSADIAIAEAEAA